MTMPEQEAPQCAECGRLLAESGAAWDGVPVCAACMEPEPEEAERPEPGAGAYLRGIGWILTAAVGSLIASMVAVWIFHIVSRFLGNLG
ncbi:MAG: hypothetical protein R2762_19255 [Bryobacteraceae bacterium]